MMGARSIVGASIKAVAVGVWAGSLCTSSLCAAIELVVRESPAFEIPVVVMEFPDQLPHSRVARSNGEVSVAWLAGPTDRYRHGVLGDTLEASRMVVRTRGGTHLRMELPANRVFEDLQPRIVDMGPGYRDQILIVESDTSLGASLAIYGIVDGKITRRMATPFLGQSSRWLNPLGVGDFDGDGKPDIALVATPHIGGILRLYRLEGGALLQFAERPGVSTHRIGSTVLAMGRVLTNRPRDWLLLPDQAQRALLLLEWSQKGWLELARAELPARMSSALIPASKGKWRLKTDAGYAEVELVRR